jgi:hypothetical protein
MSSLHSRTFNSQLNSLPSFLNHLQLPSQETPSILSQPALEPSNIAPDRPQRETPFPNYSSIVIETCLPRRRLETAVLLLRA